jgi:hypothetical protein
MHFKIVSVLVLYAIIIHRQFLDYYYSDAGDAT